MKQLSSAQATKTLKVFEEFLEARDGNERGVPSETVECKASRLWILTLFVRLVAGTADWIRTAADYYTAATIYEQLSRLSDAELQRRGLTRANLARDVTAACDRVDRSMISPADVMQRMPVVVERQRAGADASTLRTRS